MTSNLETHEDAVALVKSIFQKMGGKILPPHRPNKGYRYTLSSEQIRNNFMMDFENACLEEYWVGPPPTGPRRYLNEKWAKNILGQVYPHHSDVDWYEYVEFCESGGGDEWFQEDINE